MSYRIPGRGKSEWPEAAEQQVLDALRAFTFDTETTTIRDFTPTSVLYEVYMKHMRAADFQYREAYECLNITQFGVALRRMFNLDRERKTQRRVGGKRVMGYAGVRGPGSVTTNDGPGRPKVKP